MKKAVIFDLDGTLIDSMWVWKSIDIEYLGRRNIEVPKELNKRLEGMSFEEVAVFFKENFGLEDSVEEIVEEWNKMAWDKYEHEVKLKHGVRELLKYLKNKNIKIIKRIFLLEISFIYFKSKSRLNVVNPVNVKLFCLVIFLTISLKNELFSH